MTRDEVTELAERALQLEQHHMAEAQHSRGRKAVTVAYERAETASDLATALEALQAELDRVTGDRDYLFENREYHFTRAEAAEAEAAKLREGLLWYAHQAEGCRKITHEGDAARNALSADGGKRARALLNETAQGEQG